MSSTQLFLLEIYPRLLSLFNRNSCFVCVCCFPVSVLLSFVFFPLLSLSSFLVGAAEQRSTFRTTVCGQLPPRHNSTLLLLQFLSSLPQSLTLKLPAPPLYLPLPLSLCLSLSPFPSPPSLYPSVSLSPSPLALVTAVSLTLRVL